MPQEYRKTILIVCEGQRSEPDYFHNLRNEVLSKTSDTYIKILPIPKDEQLKIEREAVKFTLRNGAKKRNIRIAIDGREPEDFSIENEYKAQPTNYVRKAQLAHKEKNYSELWAVYDKDDHPDHHNAILLSKNEEECDLVVNIGFSSISFEEWILMHFEYCEIAFSKSQCRDSKDRIFDCGTHVNEMDCKGQKCVVGRIQEKKYLSSTSSKNFEYKDYSKHLGNALKNALVSRYLAAEKKLFYKNNPYTSIDRLVFKLHNVESGDYIWEDVNVIEISPNIKININNQEGATKIEVVNYSRITYILQKNTIMLINVLGGVEHSNRRCVLSPDEKFTFYSRNKLSLEDFQFAVFKKNEGEYAILDVVQILNF